MTTFDRHAITPAIVDEAGDFGELYFSVQDGQVTTILKPGMVIACNGYGVIITVRQDESGLKITCYTSNNNKILPFRPFPRMHVLTCRQRFDTVEISDSRLCVGDHICIISPYLCGYMNDLTEVTGVLREIFLYDEISTRMYLLETCNGLRVFLHPQMYATLQLTAEEDVNQLLPKLINVGLGTRTADGTVIAIMFFKNICNIPYYVIRDDAGTVSFFRFNDKVVAIDKSTEVLNALMSYHNQAASRNFEEIFTHQGVRLRTINRIGGKHLVALVNETNHHFNQNMVRDLPRGYLHFDRSISWADYGIFPE